MKILLIRSEGNQTHINDFMSDLLLHGLRQLHGSEVIDYPGCWYMYSDEIMNRKYDINKIWGKGFTINSTLKNYNLIDRTDIKKKIQEKYFLKKLNNSIHYLISSACITKNGSMIWNHTDSSELKMKNLNDDELSELLIISANKVYINNKGKFEKPKRLIK